MIYKTYYILKGIYVKGVKATKIPKYYFCLIYAIKTISAIFLFRIVSLCERLFNYTESIIL